MPIFDYKCNKCEHVFEKIWTGKEGIAVCPECGATETKKLVSGNHSFRLYGKGFYKQNHKDTGDWS